MEWVIYSDKIGETFSMWSFVKRENRRFSVLKKGLSSSSFGSNSQENDDVFCSLDLFEKLTLIKIQNLGIELIKSNTEKFMSTWDENWSLTFFDVFFFFWTQGNLTDLIEMTHWKGNDVLYIGDHIYGDLAVSRIQWKTWEFALFFEDLFLKHGWRTGAILEEVEDEINIINSDAFQKTIRWVKKQEEDNDFQCCEILLFRLFS